MKVEVFIPTFDRLESLKKACSSVLQQGDFVRLHVLDNASSDGSQEWLLQLAESEARVRLTLRNENLGAPRNFSDGFRSAETEYVVPLASDDELLPGFLARAIEIGKEDPDVGAVIFQSEFRKNGVTSFLNPPSLTPGRLEPAEHLRQWISTGHYFSWSGILWKQSLLKEIKAHEQFERYAFAGDAWVQFLVFSRAPVYSVSSPGAVLHMHAGQMSRKMGTESISQVAEMLKEIRRAVSTSGFFSEKENHELMERLYDHWNSVIEWGLWKNGTAFDDESIFQALNTYLTEIYPQAGFRKFPLLPLFEGHREKVSEAAIHKLRWMENSLSWKMTRPLRDLMTLKNRIFPS